MRTDKVKPCALVTIRAFAVRCGFIKFVIVCNVVVKFDVVPKGNLIGLPSIVITVTPRQFRRLIQGSKIAVLSFDIRLEVDIDTYQRICIFVIQRFVIRLREQGFCIGRQGLAVRCGNLHTFTRDTANGIFAVFGRSGSTIPIPSAERYNLAHVDYVVLGCLRINVHGQILIRNARYTVQVIFTLHFHAILTVFLCNETAVFKRYEFVMVVNADIFRRHGRNPVHGRELQRAKLGHSHRNACARSFLHNVVGFYGKLVRNLKGNLRKPFVIFPLRVSRYHIFSVPRKGVIGRIKCHRLSAIGHGITQFLIRREHGCKIHAIANGYIRFNVFRSRNAYRLHCVNIREIESNGFITAPIVPLVRVIHLQEVVFFVIIKVVAGDKRSVIRRLTVDKIQLKLNPLPRIQDGAFFTIEPTVRITVVHRFVGFFRIHINPPANVGISFFRKLFVIFYFFANIDKEGNIRVLRLILHKRSISAKSIGKPAIFAGDNFTSLTFTADERLLFKPRFIKAFHQAFLHFGIGKDVVNVGNRRPYDAYLHFVDTRFFRDERIVARFHAYTAFRVLYRVGKRFGGVRAKSINRNLVAHRYELLKIDGQGRVVVVHSRTRYRNRRRFFKGSIVFCANHVGNFVHAGVCRNEYTCRSFNVVSVWIGYVRPAIEKVSKIVEHQRFFKGNGRSASRFKAFDDVKAVHTRLRLFGRLVVVLTSTCAKRKANRREKRKQCNC